MSEVAAFTFRTAPFVVATPALFVAAIAANGVNLLSTLSGSGLTAGATVLVGDPGRSYLPKSRLIELASYQVPVTRDLEDAEVKKTTVWRMG